MRKSVSVATVILVASLATLSPRNLSAQDAGGTQPAPEAAPVANTPEVTPEEVPAIVPDAVVEPAPAPVVEPVPEPAPAASNVTDAVELSHDPSETPGIEASVDEEADLISVTLNDVPLADVVRMFTRISGANIIATSSNLEGTVTANLTDVAWYPAMSTILREHNLTLEKAPDADIYRIVPVPADAPEPMVVRTMFLRYTTVGEILPVIKGITNPGALVQGFPSRNALVIRSTAQNLSEVELLLAEIDIQSKQVCIETKFLEISDEASKRLGIRWDSLDEFGVKLQAGPYATETAVSRLKQRDDAYNRWDKRSRLDEVQERYDMYGEQREESKTTWEEVPPGSGSYAPVTVITPTRTVTDVIDNGEDATRGVMDTFNKTITESQAAILEMDSLDIVLSALKRTDGVSIVSNPKIIVDNGATNAVISVGRREPIISVEIQRGTQDSPGDKQTATLATEINTDFIKEGYLETGMNLRVVPVVKTDDLIEARIDPSLRRLIDNKVVAGNSWPIVDVKEIHTQFTLRSGQTVAIGGLIDTTDSKRTAKIPVLGSIPLIGKYLFSHEEDIKSQIELIIFVTLSLAQPDMLFEETGIPTDAKLVHKRMIQTHADKEQFHQDLEQIKSVIDEESEKPIE